MPRPKGPNKVQVLVRLTPDTVTKLKGYAEKKGESLPAYVARILEEAK